MSIRIKPGDRIKLVACSAWYDWAWNKIAIVRVNAAGGYYGEWNVRAPGASLVAGLILYPDQDNVVLLPPLKRDAIATVGLKSTTRPEVKEKRVIETVEEFRRMLQRTMRAWPLHKELVHEINPEKTAVNFYWEYEDVK